MCHLNGHARPRVKNEQKVGMMLPKGADTRGVGISNMKKSTLQPHPLATPIDSTHLLLTTPSSHTHKFQPLSTIVIHTLNLCKVKSMDDNCGEWVECMGMISRRWVWLVGVGGIYGCS